MEKMGFDAGNMAERMVRGDAFFADASKLLGDTFALAANFNDETTLLYGNGYLMDRIEESPTEWYNSKEGVEDLRKGIKALKEILVIQDDASLTQEQRAEALKPKLVTLRENYGI